MNENEKNFSYIDPQKEHLENKEDLCNISESQIKQNDSNLDTFKKIPNFLEKLNKDIQNLDNLVNNTGNAPSSPNIPQQQNKYNKLKMSAIQECDDIKNIVKQSVDGLSGILKMKTKFNANSSVKNLTENGFEVIHEEDMATNQLNKKKDLKSHLLSNNKKSKTPNLEHASISKKMSKPLNKVTNAGNNEPNSNNTSQISGNNNIRINKNAQPAKEKTSLKTSGKVASVRNQSVNKRYEQDNKESSYQEKLPDKSKSPIITKNFNIRANLKKQMSGNQNGSSNNLIADLAGYHQPRIQSKYNSKLDSYLTENKIIDSNQGSRRDIDGGVRSYSNNHNIEQFRPPISSRNVQVINKNALNSDSVNTSFNNNNTINSYRAMNLNTSANMAETPNTVSGSYDVQLFAELALLFNDSQCSGIKEQDNKFVSEDLSKLLISLLDISPAATKVDEVLINQYNWQTDNRRINAPNLTDIDPRKVAIIQRVWRKYKVKKMLSTQDKDKLQEEMKKFLLGNITANENFKKTIRLLMTCLNLFATSVKSSKSKLKLLYSDFVPH